MAQSITIDIIANLDDRATEKAKSLDELLDKLEKHRDIDLGTARLETSSAMSKLEASANKIDSFSSNKAQTTLSANTAPFDSGVNKAQKSLETVVNTQAEASIGLDTSEVATGIKSVQDGVESVKVPVKLVSDTANDENIAVDDTGISSVGYVNRNNWGYSESAMEDIAEREMLVNQASEYGLKHDKGASLQEMRDLVWGYEDEHFQAKDIAATAENTKAVAASTKATQTASEAASDTSEEFGDDGGLGRFAKSMATRLVGAAAVAKGATNVMNDLTDAIEAENSNDATRSASRGLTKAGLMGAGAAIGSFIPGVGSLFGAGAGALIGSLFGDELGDMFSGISESAEELKQKAIDKYFGSISLSANQITGAVENMLNADGWDSITNKAQSLDSALDMRDNLDASMYGIKELGSELVMLGNVGAKVTKDDLEGFTTSVESYTKDARDVLSKSLYSDLVSADQVFGHDSDLAKTISEQYANAFENIEGIEVDLSKFIKTSMKDGSLTEEEIGGIRDYVQQIQDVVESVTQSSAQSDFDMMQMLLGDGSLSYDSFTGMLSELSEQGRELTSGYAKELQRNLHTASFETNETKRATLENQAWGQYYSDTADVQSNILGTTLGYSMNSLKGQYSDFDLSGVTSGIETSASNTISKILGGLSAYETTGDNKSLAPITSLGGQSSRDILGLNSFTGDKGTDSAIQSYMADMYSNHIASQAKDLEGSMQHMLDRGQSVSPEMIENLQSGWMAGAMGNDTAAADKLLGARFASDEATRTQMKDFMSSDLASSVFSDDVIDAFKLVSDAYENASSKTADKITQAEKDTADTVEKSSKETQDQIESNAKDNAEKITDSQANTAEKADTAEEAASSPSTTAESADNPDDMHAKDLLPSEELGESVMDTLRASLDPANLDFSELGIGESLMSAMSESLKDENLDMEGLDIGENLMSALSDSISPDNLDFSEFGIGESLMAAMSESLSGDNLDFGEFGIGESLMNALSESISPDNIDFSELGIGDSIMSALSESLSGGNLDIEGLDVGEQLMSAVSASLDSVEFGEIDIGSKIMDGISTSMEGVTITLPEIEIPEIEVPELEGTINYTANFEEMGEVPEVEGTVNYTASFDGVTDAPDLDGTVNYAADFSGISDPPDLDGTVNYTADFSGIGEPPVLSGVVNYKGNFSGISAPTLTGTVNYSGGGVHHATGTRDAARGWAYVNDDGSSDPRELIEHNGEFRMYEGRDVLTYLEPHDKVYTSSQTKAILSGSVPHYASGKNNRINESIFGKNGSAKSISGNSISVGGVSLSIHVDAQNNKNVVEAISEHYDEIAEGVTERIAKQVLAISSNVPVRG